MNKKLLAVFMLLAALILTAACGKTEEAPATEEKAAPSPVQTVQEETKSNSYSYEYEGMMGRETAQLELKEDGTCLFFLPDNPVITDVYEGSYTKDGAAVEISGLKNTDSSSPYVLPGLWAWIQEGNASVTLSDDGHFVPAEGENADSSDSEAETLKNVAYASLSPAQVCDIYPVADAEKAPVIVLIHGGGFMFGDPGMTVIQPVIEAAQERGYAVVSVDYRKSSEAVFPAAVADVKAAVRFVKANAETYGFDAEHITIWGESAGAYLALMTALTPDVGTLNADVPDNMDFTSGVCALVSFYAPVEFYTLYDEAGKPEAAAGSFESKFMGQDILEDETFTYTSYWESYAEEIPTDLHAWIQAGDSDKRVPCTQSVNLAERLVNYIDGTQLEFSLIPGADHEDSAFYTAENLSAIFAWLDAIVRA